MNEARQPIYLDRHQLLADCHGLMVAIEECGASEELTAAIVKADALLHAINAHVIKSQRCHEALAGLVGTTDPDQLKKMEAAMRSLPAPAEDVAATINAIQALLA